jgi:predicted CopG family antitoxin
LEYGLVSFPHSGHSFRLITKALVLYIHMHMISFGECMMARTIAVSDDVYQLLAKSKLPSESFSDVIRRALKKGMNLSDIAGSRTITKEDWEKVIKAFSPQMKKDEERKKQLVG